MADPNPTTTAVFHCDAHEFQITTCRACAEARRCPHGIAPAVITTRRLGARPVTTRYYPEIACADCDAHRAAEALRTNQIQQEARRAAEPVTPTPTTATLTTATPAPEPIIRHRSTCARIIEQRRRMDAGFSTPFLLNNVECDCGGIVVETVRASCGHTVARALLMSASTGSSCPDCYDRMSE